MAPKATGAVLPIRHRPGCIQRPETQAHQQCCRDGHGGAEAGGPLKEGTEAKAHQDQLPRRRWSSVTERIDEQRIKCGLPVLTEIL